jgi:hypothetical protein
MPAGLPDACSLTALAHTHFLIPIDGCLLAFSRQIYAWSMASTTLRAERVPAS